MIDDTIQSVLAVEGSATFLTNGTEGPHLVATWQSYIQIVDRETLIFPAGGYRETERNLQNDSGLQMVIGSRVDGRGLGFRLRGTATIESGTDLHQRLQHKFPWCRAAVVFRVSSVEQILGA